VDSLNEESPGAKRRGSVKSSSDHNKLPRKIQKSPTSIDLDIEMQENIPILYTIIVG
jgi:hypothetical protein